MAGAYQTGIYRNVLKECGYDETVIGERLEQTFETIFYGTEAERFYHEAGGDMAYLEDTGNHDVRTEGMSYGMMVFLLTAKRQKQSCGNVFTKGSLDIRENLCGSLPII